MSQKVQTEKATVPSKKNEKPNTKPITYSDEVYLSTYSHYPDWLNKSGLTPSTRIVYVAIYNRAVSMSLRNYEQYTNSEGHIFVIYTNDDLADDCGIGLSAVKAAKSIMLELGYIGIESIENSSAIRIYPKIPTDAPTYQHKVLKSPKNDTSNSSFDTDEFFEAAIRRSLMKPSLDTES